MKQSVIKSTSYSNDYVSFFEKHVPQKCRWLVQLDLCKNPRLVSRKECEDEYFEALLDGTKSINIFGHWFEYKHEGN